MKYSVIFAKEAEKDVRGIFDYIAGTLGSRQNAAAQIRRIEKRVNALAELPERYPQYAEEPWRSRGLRVMPVDNFCVFYFVDGEAKTVFVLRIMYGKRDSEKALGE